MAKKRTKAGARKVSKAAGGQANGRKNGDREDEPAAGPSGTELEEKVVVAVESQSYAEVQGELNGSTEKYHVESHQPVADDALQPIEETGSAGQPPELTAEAINAAAGTSSSKSVSGPKEVPWACNIDHVDGINAYPPEDYLGVSDISFVSLYSPLDPKTIQSKKRKAMEPLTDHINRRRAIENTSNIAIRNQQEMDSLWVNASTNPGQDRDEIFLDGIVNLYHRILLNWNILNSWIIGREDRRLQIMEDNRLIDTPLGPDDTPNGHVIGSGGQARVYIRPNWLIKNGRNLRPRKDEPPRQLVAIKMGFKCTQMREKWWIRHLNDVWPHENLPRLLEEYSAEDMIWSFIATPVANAGDLAIFAKAYASLLPGEIFDPATMRAKTNVTFTTESTVPEEILWSAMKQVLTGLNFIHTGAISGSDPSREHWVPIIHCDIKPGNILVNFDRNGRSIESQYTFILSDFGVAIWSDEAATEGEPGNVTFAPAEWIDEAVQGRRGIYDQRADVWAVGASIHAASTFNTIRWMKNRVMNSKVFRMGVEQQLLSREKWQAQPFNPVHVHLPLDDRRRLDNGNSFSGKPLGCDIDEQRVYSRAFSYHLLHLLSYISTPTDALAPEFERPCAGDALRDVENTLSQIWATPVPSDTVSSVYSDFDLRARACTAKSVVDQALFDFHTQETIKRFKKARQLASRDERHYEKMAITRVLEYTFNIDQDEIKADDSSHGTETTIADETDYGYGNDPQPDSGPDSLFDERSWAERNHNARQSREADIK